MNRMASMSSFFKTPPSRSRCTPNRQRSEAHTSGGAMRCRSRLIIFLNRFALSAVSLKMGYSSSKRYSSFGTTEIIALIFLFLKIHFIHVPFRRGNGVSQHQILLLLCFHHVRQVRRGDNRTNLPRFYCHAVFRVCHRQNRKDCQRIPG